MEIEGRLILDLPMTEGVGKTSGKPWKKKEWVIETINTQYPRQVHFSAFGDRADNLHLEVGKVYTISVDAESREFNGRWYTDLRAYAARESAPANSFGPQQQQQPFGQPQPPQPGFGAPAGGFNSNPMPPADGTDDLPF